MDSCNMRIILCVWVMMMMIVIPLPAQENYTLEKAIEQAAISNPLLRINVYEVNKGAASLTTAVLWRNPAFNMQPLQLTDPSHFRKNTSWSSGENRQTWWQLTKSFQLPQQRPGKIAMARLHYDFLKDEFAALQQNVFHEVAIKWNEVRTTEEQFGLLKEGKDIADSLVRVNRARVKDQVITETDLLRLQLIAQQMEVRMINNRKDLHVHLQELRYLLGINDSIRVSMIDSLNYFPSLTLDTLLSYAMKHRYEVISERTKAAMAERNISYQRSLAWPQPEAGVIWNPQNSIPYFGFYGTIELPIFRRNQGEMQKSFITRIQSDERVRAAELKVRSEVLTAFNSFISERKSLRVYKEVSRNSESVLSSVLYSYRHGATTIIDYLNAQRSWLEIHQQYYDALRHYRESCIELLFATGKLDSETVLRH